MELFKLLGRIVIENSDANRALDETSDKAKDVADDVGDMADGGDKSGGKLKSAFSKIGSAAVAVGKTVATGIGVASVAIGGLTVKALNAAGELEQNMGGSEAVFGKYAGKMQDTAKTAFKNMGLSTSDFLATANKMGALFQGSGFGIEESATMSADAMQRAADVASIMGIDTASAMEAIAGAAKGNFTMLDNLGVAMNDTTLNAYAMEKGIGKTTQEMTNQEKIGLAMEMFMEKTAYAAGNYAKENETLAGSLGTAKAALSNFIAGSGTVEDVVSSFSNAANVIVSNIGTMFPKLMTGITSLVTQITPMIPPLLQQLLPPLITGATSLINGLVAAMPQVIQALIGAVPALISGITQIVNALIAALPSLVQMLCAALPTLIPAIVTGIVSMIVTLCSMLPQIIQPIIDNLPTIIISIVNALMDNLPALINGVISLVLGIVNALPQIIQALIGALPTVVQMIVEGVLRSLPALITGAIQLVIGIVKALPQIMSSLRQALPNAMKGIYAAVKNVFSDVGAWFGDKFRGAKEKVVSAFSDIKDKLAKPFNTARDKIKGIADKIKGFFKGNISMPKIKLPHFSIKPKGWKIGDLLEGSIPKLGIDWYAKAMNNPMVMNQPTIFGYNASTGKLQGGGENGSEVVSGTNTLMNMIGAVVESKTNGQTERIIVVLTAILEAILNGNSDLIRAILAGHVIEINGREFGRTVREYA
jgi:phage-related protein